MANLANRIDFQSYSHPDIDNCIDRLKKRHVELMKELSKVDQDLKAKEQKLTDLLGTIATM
jgi:prefoldin subunit 5